MTSPPKITMSSATHLKLYSGRAVLMITAIASPLAGAVLMALNYGQIGRTLAALVWLIIGIALQLLVLTIAKDHSTWGLIFPLQILLGLCMKQMVYKKEFEPLLEQGASTRSGWLALGIAILCCVVIYLGQLIQIFVSPSGKYIMEAASHLHKREYKEAVDDLSNVIQLNPKNANAYYKRGIIYEQLNQYQKAINDFSSATDLNSHYASAYCERGNSYFNLGQHQKAIQDCSKAINLNAKIADAYYIRGKSYAALKKYDLAKNDNEQAIKLGYLQPNDKTIIRKWKD
jgi:tetratricopeptide (TPR) repeat protein